MGGSYFSVKRQSRSDCDLPIVEAMMERALELDEALRGAIHAFLITYEISRAGRATRRRLDQAAFRTSGALSGAHRRDLFVSLAESLAFSSKISRSLIVAAAGAGDKPGMPARISSGHLVMQRRAKWLLSRPTSFFCTRFPGK